MSALLPSTTLGIAIRCDPRRAYAFIAEPANLPRWATSFVKSAQRSDGGWVMQTSYGPMRFRFAPANTLGVVDHFVAAADGPEVYVPMRVVANGQGSEVLCTLFRRPEMSDEHYAADQRLVKQDLATLKRVLEQEG